MRRLRLLTANLWNGRADPTAFADLLAELAPDVLATQELSPEQAMAIAGVLPHGKLEPGRQHDGMGLSLARPGSVTRLELPGRAARRVDLDPLEWPGLETRLEILNVHIQAPHTLPPWRVLPRRRAQLLALTRYLDETPAPARLLAGDLNATPLWPAYRRVAARLRDAALHRDRAARPSRTWGPRPGVPRLLRIDHVFHSGVDIEAVRTVPIRGGDHCAVLADLLA